MPKIVRVAMDGSNGTTVVGSNLGQPRAVAVDHPVGQEGGRIYWTDMLRVRIESAALDGSDRRVVVRK